MIDADIKFCGTCQEMVTTYEDEEGCPFCGGLIESLAEYIDGLEEKLENSGG